MDIQNITEWASPEIKTIEVSPLVGRTYKVEVREFIPTEGDMLDEFWSDGGVVKAHRMPPYALVNLDEAANARKQFVYNNFGSYIRAMVDKTEPLIWNTYVMAFKYSREAPVSCHEFSTRSHEGSLTNTT
jgi:hypothetical protein